MYIIDKNKDYYDYLKGTYGIDKTIVYDRRGSTVLSEVALLEYVSFLYFDKIQSTEHFVVEIGEVQYLFRVVIDYGFHIHDCNKVSYPFRGKFELVNTFKEHKHYFDSAISLVPVKVGTAWKWQPWRKGEEIYPLITSLGEVQIDTSKILPNPILKDTSIASFIGTLDIWIELNNFISSKYNDKTVTIKNSDVDKLINRGFDKKTSFRNPIKWGSN
jgi:hypothetical protein